MRGTSLGASVDAALVAGDQPPPYVVISRIPPVCQVRPDHDPAAACVAASAIVRSNPRNARCTGGDQGAEQGRAEYAAALTFPYGSAMMTGDAPGADAVMDAQNDAVRGLHELRREMRLAEQALAEPGAGAIGNLECRLADLQGQMIMAEA
jgi:hypothetical protein